MKAMLLAAGEGRRMRPLTLTTPKPLLPVAGRPLLEHSLLRLAAAGITELVINRSWLGEQLLDYFGDGSRWGISIAWSPEAQPLETAGAVMQALPLLGEEPFLLINGDIYSDFPLAQLIAQQSLLREECVASLVMVDNPAHHPQGDFYLRDGVVSTAGSGAKLTFSGISLWRPAPFAARAARSGSEPLPLRELLLPLLAQQQVIGQHWRGSWCDVGTPERYAVLQQSVER